MKNMTWKRASIGLFILLAIMTVADGLLVRQNLQMRRLVQPAAAAGLQTGVQLQPLTGVDFSGQRIDLSYDGTGPRRIYFYFTSTCSFCRRQFPYWKQILSESANHNLQAIGLVKASEDKKALRLFLDQVGCSLDSPTPLKIAFIDDGLRRNYGLSATPVTLLTNSRGAVEKSWVGAWTDTERVEATSLLKFTISPQ
jgi:hypothetical protein